MVPSSGSRAISARLSSPDGASLIIVPRYPVVSRPRPGRRDRLRGRDEITAFLQDEERPILCIAVSDQVLEDHIDLLLQSHLEPRLSIIKNLTCANGLEGTRFIIAKLVVAR